MFDGLDGSSKSLRLGGIIGSCRPNAYGNVASSESDSIVKMLGSGEVTDDVDILSLVRFPDKSFELSTIGLLLPKGLCSTKVCST